MSFRFRIAAWVVLSCTLLIGLMMVTGYRQLEEELREGRKDDTHPQVKGWSIHNSYAEAEIQDILGEMVETWLWVAVPTIGLSLGAGLLLARRSLRPVHQINRQLADMKPDSLKGGITLPEADPVISDLASHLNGLLDKAGTAYQEMAEYSAHVAHELRTPLMLLRMRIEHAPAGIPPAFQEDLQDELARLSRFVERSLLAAKAEQGSLRAEMMEIDLSELVADVTEDYQLLAAEKELGLVMDLEPGVRVHADADLLRQALHGLLENALRYAKSSIHVECKATPRGVMLGIHNDCDLSTTNTGGLGLGLRLVRGICKASRAGFEVHEQDHSFRVEIRFQTGKEFP